MTKWSVYDAPGSRRGRPPGLTCARSYLLLNAAAMDLVGTETRFVNIVVNGTKWGLQPSTEGGRALSHRANDRQGAVYAPSFIADRGLKGKRFSLTEQDGVFVATEVPR